MSAVTIIWDGTNAEQKNWWSQLLTNLGHTATARAYSTVTGTSENGQDLIVVTQLTAAQWATIETYLKNYHDGTSPATSAIPMIVGPMTAASGIPIGGGPVNDSPASFLGLVASLDASNVQGDEDDSGLTLSDDWRESGVTEASNSRLEPVFSARAEVVKVDHVSGVQVEVAGKVLAETDAGLPLMCSVDVGDSKILAVGGTFAARAVWFGWADWTYGMTVDGSVLAATAVQYCLGDYASLAFPTSSSSANIRTPSMSLAAAGLYLDSEVTWQADLPAGTSVTVEASLDGESFSTVVASGNAIPNLLLNDDLTNVRVWFKITLATSDGSVTPTFWDLRVMVEGTAAAVTASPTDYFAGGQAQFTSGENSGRQMEIKSYDSLTQEVELFLPMVRDIAVGDTLTMLPGCDKRLETCRDKFNNVLNFQGEPNVPGDDVMLQTPDVKV